MDAAAMTIETIRDTAERVGFEMFGPTFPRVSVDAEGAMVVVGRWSIHLDDECPPPVWAIDEAQPHGGGPDEPPGVDVVPASMYVDPTQAIAFIMAEYARDLALDLMWRLAEAEAPEDAAF